MLRWTPFDDYSQKSTQVLGLCAAASTSRFAEIPVPRSGREDAKGRICALH